LMEFKWVKFSNCNLKATLNLVKPLTVTYLLQLIWIFPKHFYICSIKATTIED
jgi:hypothetical protein